MDSLRKVLVVALLVFMTHGTAVADTQGSEPVVIGATYVLDSEVLKEQRTYLVHLPPDYARSKARYPVLILLDGDAHFTHTSGTVDYLAQNLRIPDMIVVGIANTDRFRDMTPPLPAAAKRMANEGSPDGAKNFLAFIADELLPHLDSIYRTQQYRVLIGHSLGGLFATYSLVTRPEIFDAYISISPSLWWDDESLVTATKELLKQQGDLRADLFLTLGQEGRQMLGGYWRFAAVLGEAEPPNLRWKVNRWPDESHGSIPLRATLEGLQAIFDGYYVHEPLLAYDRLGLSGLTEQFQRVSTRLGYDVPVPDVVFATLLSVLPELKRMDNLEPIALQRLEAYPDSAEAHFALGLLYAARSDNPRAAEYFSKGLKLYPGSQEARTALTALGLDPKTVVPEATPTRKMLRSYVGRYEAGTEVAPVTLERDTLYFENEGARCKLEASSEDRFYCVGSDVELTFKRDAAGRVRGVLVQQPTTAYELRKIS